MITIAIGLSLWVFPQSTQAKNNSSAASAVTITIDVVFGGEETFTTTGDALCPSGTAISIPHDNNFTGGDPSSSDAHTFHLDKVLTCDDNSGTFTIGVQAANEPCGPTDTGGWHVVSGTGAYENLQGGGHLVGTVTGDPCNPPGIIDVYTGMVRNR